MNFHHEKQLLDYLSEHPSISRLTITNCTGMTKLPTLPDTVRNLYLQNCLNLIEVSQLPSALTGIGRLFLVYKLNWQKISSQRLGALL
jgi:hypothetical protein